MWFGVCDIIKAGYFYFLRPHSAVVLLLYSLMVHQLRSDAAVYLIGSVLFAESHFIESMCVFKTTGGSNKAFCHFHNFWCSFHFQTMLTLNCPNGVKRFSFSQKPEKVFPPETPIDCIERSTFWQSRGTCISSNKLQTINYNLDSVRVFFAFTFALEKLLVLVRSLSLSLAANSLQTI